MSDSARVSAEAGRDTLAHLLAGVSAAQLAAVARDLFSFLPLPPEFDWNDGRAVVDKIASLDSPIAGVSSLILYTARLSHEVGRLDSLAFGRWADAAGRESGMSAAQLRNLFTRMGSASRQSDPALLEDAGGYASQSRQITHDLRSEGALSIQSTILGPAVVNNDQPQQGRVWGNVPPRNPSFTGRESLLLSLQRSLETRSKASVLPHALHGSGGVGKSQLAVEFAYRFAERYDLVWWVPAEQQTLVLQSLAELGRVLRIPATQEFTQAASLVLDALATTELRWLLIFDNANDPDELGHLIPTSGGHVILTSRNTAWTDVWDPIKVDVFQRHESIELIQRRGTGIEVAQAEQLADRLGDLPLALDQAASWQSATGTPVADYLALLDRHYHAFRAQGRRIAYPKSIATLVSLVLEHLQESLPAVAQLFELFAVFGAEPISIDLLHRGRLGDISPPLGRALRDSTARSRIVRDLRRFGLARVDVDERIQVHRLFQVALRDVLSIDRLEQSRTNVHRLIGAANPGDPDNSLTDRLHAELAPHVLPSGLITASDRDARWVVLDQIRYLWLIGDNEGSRRLGEAAVESWENRTDQADLGPVGELTLLAKRHLSTTLLSLGINGRARELAENALEGFRQSLSPDHEHTLWAANVFARHLRVEGEFKRAYITDSETVRLSELAYGPEDSFTLRVRNNLAVDLRMLSDFKGAFEIDRDVVSRLDETLAEQHRRVLFAHSNLARDHYGLGDYSEALRILERILPMYRGTMTNPMHSEILLARRTLAMALRKTGKHDEALRVGRANYRDSTAVFGEAHEHALSATMTYANTLRVLGGLDEARSLATDSLAKYQRTFGRTHPLTLTALVNLATVERARGDAAEAYRHDTTAHEAMVTLLGAEHGYTLCAASGVANDLALLGEFEAARELSARTLSMSRNSRGHDHPYTLLCAVNAAFDEVAAGNTELGGQHLEAVTGTLSRLLGADHPEILDLRRGLRAECDIEPPPT